MNCDEARRLIDLKLDGELDPSGVQRLTRHLDGCERCRRDHALLHRIERAIESISIERAPAYLTSAVGQELERVRLAGQRARLAAACGAGGVAVFGATRLFLFGLSWLTQERLAGAVDGWSGALNRATLPLQERAPALLESLSELSGAGAVVYTVIGLAGVFLALQALRISKELAIEWHPDSVARIR